MSFTIELYKNNSDDIVVDKKLSLITTLIGDLKTDTSIIDPIITIEATMEDVSNLNYIKIADFKRSYFVIGIKSLRTNIWEISCHVDVITSFASEIRANKAIISRQENNWNLFLNDDSIRCYQNPHIITKEFPKGFTTTSPSFILLVAGSPNDTLEPSQLAESEE